MSAGCDCLQNYKPSLEHQRVQTVEEPRVVSTLLLPLKHLLNAQAAHCDAV